MRTPIYLDTITGDALVKALAWEAARCEVQIQRLMKDAMHPELIIDLTTRKAHFQFLSETARAIGLSTRASR